MPVTVKWIGSPNFRKQVGVKKKFIVMHWIVGTLASADKIFQNASRRVATNYGVGPGKIHQYVKDTDYAFGSGTTYANKYGISIEHEGGWLLKDGTRKKPTKATLEASAALCAELARVHNLGKLELGKNVFPHKHFVATQCPGTLDMEYIIKQANKINECIGVEFKPEPEPVKPAPVKTYTIKRGDSYWRIAGILLKTKDSSKIVKEVARLQKLNNNKSLRVGDTIKI